MSEPGPENISELQVAMACIVGVFHKYASKDGDAKTLSKHEVKELLEEQLPLLKEMLDGEGNDLVEGLDRDGDGKLNFLEFSAILMEICTHIASFVANA